MHFPQNIQKVLPSFDGQSRIRDQTKTRDSTSTNCLSKTISSPQITKKSGDSMKIERNGRHSRVYLYAAQCPVWQACGPAHGRSGIIVRSLPVLPMTDAMDPSDLAAPALKERCCRTGAGAAAD
jgi:hypothetical protein